MHTRGREARLGATERPSYGADAASAKSSVAASECCEENAIFVDSFLYDEDALDELYDTPDSGFSRCYCPDIQNPKICLPLSA